MLLKKHSFPEKNQEFLRKKIGQQNNTLIKRQIQALFLENYEITIFSTSFSPILNLPTVKMLFLTVSMLSYNRKNVIFLTAFMLLFNRKNVIFNRIIVILIQ